MATVSSTFLLDGQASATFALAPRQTATFSVTLTGSSAFVVRLLEKNGSAWNIVSLHRADVSAAIIENASPNVRYFSVDAQSVGANNSIAVELADVSGDNLTEWKNGDGTTVFAISETGIESPLLTATAATITTTTGNLTGNVTGDSAGTHTGAVVAPSIAGNDASLGITGLAAAQGGAIVVTGGTSSTGANAGGAVSLVGGVAGASGVGGAVAVTASAGGATTGKGGAAGLTAGAGTANNSHGGSVVLTPGAKHGTGLDGGTFNRGTFLFRKMATPATATDTASLTDAQMTAGVLVATPTAAAAYTVRTGTQLLAALPTDIAADDAFDLTIINLGGTGDDITLTAATDITIVGDPVVGPIADVATEQSSVGTFRFRYIGTTVFVAYRVA